MTDIPQADGVPYSSSSVSSSKSCKAPYDQEKEERRVMTKTEYTSNFAELDDLSNTPR